MTYILYITLLTPYSAQQHTFLCIMDLGTNYTVDGRLCRDCEFYYSTKSK